MQQKIEQSLGSFLRAPRAAPVTRHSRL